MLLILFFSLFFAGIAYLLYLHVVFPELVPFHGGGERVTLNTTNNYTSQRLLEYLALISMKYGIDSNDFFGMQKPFD